MSGFRQSRLTQTPDFLPLPEDIGQFFNSLTLLFLENMLIDVEQHRNIPVSHNFRYCTDIRACGQRIGSIGMAQVVGANTANYSGFFQCRAPSSRYALDRFSSSMYDKTTILFQILNFPGF